MALIRTRDGVRRAETRVDAGYSLIEVLVSVVLLALIVIPIVDSVRTTIAVSVTSRYSAQVESTLINAADRVNRAPLSCDYDEYAQAAVQTRGWSVQSASSNTSWYDPISHAWSTVGGGCRFDQPTADLVQLVSITITSPDGRIQRSIQVVKSRV